MSPPLVPELDVSDLAVSIAFYTNVCGFSIKYERPDEKFAYLERESAELMIEEAAGPGRRFHTAPLGRPYGRGMNLQIKVSDVNAIRIGSQRRCNSYRSHRRALVQDRRS